MIGLLATELSSSEIIPRIRFNAGVDSIKVLRTNKCAWYIDQGLGKRLLMQVVFLLDTSFQLPEPLEYREKMGMHGAENIRTLGRGGKFR